MRLARRPLLALVALLVSFAAAAAQAGHPVRTYRNQVGTAVLLVRAGDEEIELRHLGTHRTLSIPAFPTRHGLSGHAPSGEVVSLGDVQGQPYLRFGATLVPLAPIGPAQYAAAQAGQRR